MNAGASGPLVRVDPRVKLLWLLATLVGGLVFADVPSLAALLLSIVVVAAAGGVLGETARRVQGLVTIIAVVGLIFGITVPGAPLFGVSLFGLFVAISRDGLLLGLVSALRMCIFAAPLVVMVYWLGRISYVTRHEQIELLDRTFTAVFGPSGDAGDAGPRVLDRRAQDPARRDDERLHPLPMTHAAETSATGLPWATLPSIVGPAEPDAEGAVLFDRIASPEPSLAPA